MADKKIKLIVATDHGSVRVKTPAKVIGDKQTTTNLRYKHGRNLNYDPKEVLAFRDPKEDWLACSYHKFILHFCRRGYVSMLSQQLQSLRELLPEHVSARRHQPGGNDCAGGADGE